MSDDRPTAGTCQDCGEPDGKTMDFLVSDAIWNYVMAGQERTTLTIRPGLFDERLMPRSEGVPGVVCLACFDVRAQRAGVEYRQHLVVFGHGCWMGSFNVGDGGDWTGWKVIPSSGWARCDTMSRVLALDDWDGRYRIANIESPEMNAGFCDPAAAAKHVGPLGAVITESTVPHADWTACRDLPIFIEIDPNVAIVRDKGVKHLVDYGRVVTGNQLVIPAFFITQNAWWDGSQGTFETYWDHLRETWPTPLPFALYAAENVPDWRVIK